MPPSIAWTIWVPEVGMALPLPVTTSSTRAAAIQSSSVRKAASTI